MNYFALYGHFIIINSNMPTHNILAIDKIASQISSHQINKCELFYISDWLEKPRKRKDISIDEFYEILIG